MQLDKILNEQPFKIEKTFYGEIEDVNIEIQLRIRPKSNFRGSYHERFWYFEFWYDDVCVVTDYVYGDRPAAFGPPVYDDRYDFDDLRTIQHYVFKRLYDYVETRRKNASSIAYQWKKSAETLKAVVQKHELIKDMLEV